MRELEGHRKAVCCLAYSPDGITLASAGLDEEVRLWDVRTGQTKDTLSGYKEPLFSLAWSPNGRVLAVGASSQITLEEVGCGMSVSIQADLGGTCAATFTREGDALLVAGFLSTRIRAWGAPQGGVWTEFGQEWGELPYHRHVLGELFGFRHGVLALAVAPHAPWLASAGDAGELLLWDTERFRGRAALHGHTRAVFAVAFSPDGRLLASADKAGVVKVWNPETAAERLTLHGHRRPARAVAFTPDGRALLSASEDGTIRQWDAESGRQTAAWDWQLGGVNCVALAPDGMTAAAAGRGGRVLVWDLD